MISWFGIRGIGSVFYLMFALRQGVTGSLAQELIMLTLMTVTASIPSRKAAFGAGHVTPPYLS
jgi:NhaP-type Na+/H+ or K+/H+ antiporter